VTKLHFVQITLLELDEETIQMCPHVYVQTRQQTLEWSCFVLLLVAGRTVDRSLILPCDESVPCYVDNFKLY
jgi:hypothetical protein